VLVPCDIGILRHAVQFLHLKGMPVIVYWFSSFAILMMFVLAVLCQEDMTLIFQCYAYFPDAVLLFILLM